MLQEQKRSVQFRSIEVLEFAYTVGDNPSVSSGVPLSMEWKTQSKTILPLCAFETHRPPRSREFGRPRRLCSRRREKILLRNGCSIQDITAAARDALRIQKERSLTQFQLQIPGKPMVHCRRQRDHIHQEPKKRITTAPHKFRFQSIGVCETSAFSLSPDSDRNSSSQCQIYPSNMLQEQKRSVQFRSIEILEFAYTVGDNPSVSSGVPISMERKTQMKTILPLSVFEMHRPPRSSECGRPRKICGRRREKILLRNGCSIQDMTAAARDVLRIQKDRAFTQYLLQTQKLVMHSRRQRDVHQGPAEVTAPSPPRISIIRKKTLPAADRSPVWLKRQSSQMASSTTINTVSPRATVKENKLAPRSSPTMIQRPRLTSMIARSA
jgi:hypothetical protein